MEVPRKSVLEKMREAAETAERKKLAQDVTPTHTDELDEWSQYVLDNPQSTGPTLAEQEANPRLCEITPRCEGMPEKTYCQGGWHHRRRFTVINNEWIWSAYERCPIQIRKDTSERMSKPSLKEVRQWT